MPAANPNVKRAGARLRALREAKQWIQRDVEEETARRFGEDNAILVPQVSRIEKGSFDRPIMDDVVRLGLIYGLDPNQVAALYGLYPEEPDTSGPEVIEEALELSRSLPEDLRTEHLSWVEFANMQARAKARERMRARAGAE